MEPPPKKKTENSSNKTSEWKIQKPQRQRYLTNHRPKSASQNGNLPCRAAILERSWTGWTSGYPEVIKHGLEKRGKHSLESVNRLRLDVIFMWMKDVSWCFHHRFYFQVGIRNREWTPEMKPGDFPLPFRRPGFCGTFAPYESPGIPPTSSHGIPWMSVLACCCSPSATANFGSVRHGFAWRSRALQSPAPWPRERTRTVVILVPWKLWPKHTSAWFVWIRRKTPRIVGGLSSSKVADQEDVRICCVCCASNCQSCGKLKRPSELRRKKQEYTNPLWSINIHKPYRITWIPLSIWLKHIQRDDCWGPKQACAGAAFSPHSMDSPGKGNLRRWKDLAGDFLETLPGQRNYPQSTVIWLDNISPSPFVLPFRVLLFHCHVSYWYIAGGQNLSALLNCSAWRRLPGVGTRCILNELEFFSRAV